VGLRPSKIGKVMGEDDDGSETTETVDPVETVRPGDDNGGSVASASLRRSSSTVESGRVGGDRSVVRSRSSTNDPSLLLVPVSRVGTSVTLLARSNLSDARRVLGHAVSGGVVGADGRSATGLDAGLVTERALTVTTEVGTGRSGVEVTAVVLVAAVVVTVTGLGLCR
jgi:hypothetical protein